LRNDIPHGNWIEFRLKNRVGREKQSIGFGDGATVIARAGGVELRRTVTSASYLSQDSRRVHIGLGAAKKVDRVEVRWLGGRSETWENLEANRTWDLVEGERSQNQLVEFWNKQRAAMDAMKKDRDPARAAQLFREALALNPGHEDSHYYLANSLAALGDTQGALAELDELARMNPQSHRAFQRRGELMAASAQAKPELARAEASLETAHRLNPEETGTLLLLGEVALARGDLDKARERFELACRANPRASGALFLRGYIAWRRGDANRAAELLASAQAARGKEWKPKGSVAEGDVERRMHRESGFLSLFWEAWDGGQNAASAYAPLAAYLRRL
jgi:tetratricopeptide (TPR) repeat protein